MEPEVVEKFTQWWESIREGYTVSKYRYKNGRAITCTCRTTPRECPNPFLNMIRDVYQFHTKGKYIPHAYLTASRESRLQLLAGFIDADGHWNKRQRRYQMTQKSESVTDGIITLIRSLGFATYKHLHIQQAGKKRNRDGLMVERARKECHYFGFSGPTHLVPCIVGRKVAPDIIPRKKRDPLHVPLKSIEKTDLCGDFAMVQFGGASDVAHQYQTDDFIVHAF